MTTTKPNPRCPVCGVPMERTERGALRCWDSLGHVMTQMGCQLVVWTGLSIQKPTTIGKHDKRIQKHKEAQP